MSWEGFGEPSESALTALQARRGAAPSHLERAHPEIHLLSLGRARLLTRLHGQLQRGQASPSLRGIRVRAGQVGWEADGGQRLSRYFQEL